MLHTGLYSASRGGNVECGWLGMQFVLEMRSCRGREGELVIICVCVKGKAVPLQAWSGPEGSRKLKFPDYMTTAQDGGKVVSLTHWPPLPPGNTPGTHFC